MGKALTQWGLTDLVFFVVEKPPKRTTGKYCSGFQWVLGFVGRVFCWVLSSFFTVVSCCMLKLHGQTGELRNKGKSLSGRANQD